MGFFASSNQKKELQLQAVLPPYADLIVKVGLNMQPGQRLFILARQLEVAPLARAVTASAYRHGAPLVSVLWLDEWMNKVRFQQAPPGSFEEYPTWMYASLLAGIERGDAYLQIDGADPDLLSDLEADRAPYPGAETYGERIGLYGRASGVHYRSISEHQGKNSVQWCFVCQPTAAWAAKVFPGAPPKEAVEQLWRAVAAACRLGQPEDRLGQPEDRLGQPEDRLGQPQVSKPGPASFWQQHLDNLEQRKEFLNAKQYSALHFSAPAPDGGPGTDLRVALPRGHVWAGGSAHTRAGVVFAPNLPTEEVFTLPHRMGTEGVVISTRPLNHRGSLVENFRLTFREGKVVDYTAGKGGPVLGKLLDTDPDARRLGEVALVPYHSPISQSGLVFWNTLYDENAASHLALGGAYRFNLHNGPDMSADEFMHAGGNESLIHVDFMFGSGSMDVEGLHGDGTGEPLMRAGEWVL